MTPWLSYLVPVHNVEKYIEKCVTSMISQNITGIEIILYDDGSTDQSYEICCSLEKKYPEIIKLLKGKANKGVSTARNELLAAAKGQYIWFIDSDDYLLPNSLSKIQSIIEAYKPDLIICDYLNRGVQKTSFKGPKNVLSTDQDKLLAGIFNERKMYCWQKIVKKEVYDKVSKFPDGQIFEDIYVVPQLLFETKSFYYLPEMLIHYTYREDSILGEFARTKAEFNVKKHRDFLHSFSSLAPIVQNPSAYHKDVLFWGANFIAREYTKTSKRYHLKSSEPKPSLLEYKQMFEAASPLNFKKLKWAYLRRGRFILFAKLFRSCRAAKP